MRLPILIVASWLFATAGQVPAPASPLSAFDFFAGSCWVGTFPDGKQTDEHCFEWVYDRKYVRDRHVVRGGQPYEGETIHYWDATAKRLAYAYWNSDGLMSLGRTEPFADGIVFFQSYGPVDVRSTWTKKGRDSYEIRLEQQSGQEWKPMRTTTMTRKR